MSNPHAVPEGGSVKHGAITGANAVGAVPPEHEDGSSAECGAASPNHTPFQSSTPQVSHHTLSPRRTLPTPNVLRVST